MRTAAAQVLRRPGPLLARLRAGAGAVPGALSPSPRLRLRLLVAAAVVVLVGSLYMLWFRDSSFVAVEDVTVTGLTSADAERVRAALAASGREMTTLHVDREALEETAGAFSTVAAIEVSTDFPHGLRVHVVEHRPAALLVAGERRLPIAGDGSVLEGLPLPEGGLPEVRGSGEISELQLSSGSALDAVRVAGGAPVALRSRLDSVAREGERGIVVSVEEGPDLIFGTAGDVAAKWVAAVRVLADPDAAGAEYIDVRLPSRPAAGGLPVETVAPVAPAGGAPSADAGDDAPAAETGAGPVEEGPGAEADAAPPAADPAASAPAAEAAPPATVEPAAPEAGGVSADP